MAELYLRLDRPADSIAQLNLWIPKNPESPLLMPALASRCFARGLLGQDLQTAMGDCNRALWLGPKFAPAFSARGLVHFRLGEWAAAVADFDRAVALSPKSAWALYVRGQAKGKLGQAEAGKADMAEAIKLKPDMEAEAKPYGLTPQGN
jgi:tetratricopeptide (TPR) repeat protein